MFWVFIVGILLLVIFLIKIVATSIVLPFLLLYIIIQSFVGCQDQKSLYFGSYQGGYARCSVLLGSAKIIVPKETVIAQGPPLEYKTIIGSSSIDLTSLDVQTLRSMGQAIVVQCDNSLGSTQLKIAKEIPVRITAKGFLGQVELPDNTTIVIGAHTYRSHPQEQPLLIIYSTTVLGKTTIERI